MEPLRHCHRKLWLFNCFAFLFLLSFYLLAFEREGSKLKGGETPLCTLTTAHRMILQTVPISSQFSVSDLLSLDFALLTLRSVILIFSSQALNEAFDRLVSSSSKRYRSSTDDLSPGSLPGVLLLSNGTLILEVGFTLRCLQRLSRPHFASLLCRWHDNSCTSDASTPVLSY